MNKIENLNIDLIFFTKYVVNFIYNSHNSKDKTNISPLKIQNILYFLYTYSLTACKQKLWNDNFEKWTIGPIIPKIYYEYSKHGVELIEDENYFFKIPELTNVEKLDLEALMLDINEKYSIFEINKLACDHVWKNTKIDSKINDQEIIKYYSENETFFDKLYDPSLETKIKFLS